MENLRAEAAQQGDIQAERIASAAQTAAFFLMTGVDLATAGSLASDKRARLMYRVERLLERERLKGARGHWSYDLARHIALKQALERLKNPLETKRRLAAPSFK